MTMTGEAWDGIEAAVDLVSRGKVMLLSGAGLSTESGIPDYRGPTGTARHGSPMTYEEFTRSETSRRRYWARSHVGWRAVADARPNAGHDAVTSLERGGQLSGIITQNVDGLHQAAGASVVIELHGNLSAVVCLGCAARTPRLWLDERLRLANADWDGVSGLARPDGDALISEEAVAKFAVVPCVDCGGILKPDVVFFGESVPRDRAASSFAVLESSSALLVVGSSLQVMSGYRFVLRAAQMDKPVIIVNQGATRGDAQAMLRIDAPLGEALPCLVSQLAVAAG
jgi:NAD-dependent SIR2 family protein deacetylase